MPDPTPSRRKTVATPKGPLAAAVRLLDTLSLAGLDPFLRVGILAALGGAAAGIALVFILRTPGHEPAPAPPSHAAENAQEEPAAVVERARASLVLADPENGHARALDEIPPEPVIEAQPTRLQAARSVPEAAAPPENAAPPVSPAQTPPAVPDAAAGPAVAIPESGDAAIAAQTTESPPAPEKKEAPKGAETSVETGAGEAEIAHLAPPPKPPPAPVLNGSVPMIAIVIDDMGLDRRRSRRAVGLPGPLTLSYLTYADDLPSQTATAAENGHELMLHVAMEPTNPAIDPGPDVLLTSHDEGEILARLRRGLDRFDGFAGINNHMGSKFTADAASLMTVMAELQRRSLFFLDSRTSSKSVADRVAFEFGVPFAVRNVFLDDTDDAAGVAQRLAQTERIAAEQGHAIAIGHPKDRTLDALEAWLPGLGGRGFRLVPVSEVIAALMAPPSE